MFVLRARMEGIFFFVIRASVELKCEAACYCDIRTARERERHRDGGERESKWEREKGREGEKESERQSGEDQTVAKFLLQRLMASPRTANGSSFHSED